MKKSVGRKIVLSSERVRNLSPNELGKAAGGTTTTVSLDSHYCPSVYCSALTQCFSDDCVLTILKPGSRACP